MGYNIALIIGIGLFITSIAIIQQRLSFIRRSERTTGTVILLRKETDSDGDVTYRPIFSFKTKTNKEIVLPHWVTSASPEWSIGDDATIIYDPDDPDNAKLYSYFGVFGFAAVLMAVSMPFIVIGGGYHLADMILK